MLHDKLHLLHTLFAKKTQKNADLKIQERFGALLTKWCNYII